MMKMGFYEIDTQIHEILKHSTNSRLILDYSSLPTYLFTSKPPTPPVHLISYVNSSSNISTHSHPSTSPITPTHQPHTSNSIPPPSNPPPQCEMEMIADHPKVRSGSRRPITPQGTPMSRKCQRIGGLCVWSCHALPAKQTASRECRIVESRTVTMIPLPVHFVFSSLRSLQ